MSITDSQEFPIYKFPRYGKTRLKVKREGETLASLILDPINVEEESVDKSSTAYTNFTEYIKLLEDPIGSTEEIESTTEGITLLTESARLVFNIIETFLSPLLYALFTISSTFQSYNVFAVVIRALSSAVKLHFEISLKFPPHGWLFQLMLVSFLN